jgi:O-antigen/teichoic acid export membrane protein
MARGLEPRAYAEAFAVLGALSLLVTPAQVVQTLVARRAAELVALGRLDELRSVTRTVVRWTGLVSLLLALGIAAASPLIQSALQLTSPWPVVVAGVAAGALTFEPVARGLTQGAREFIGLGFALAAHGLGRLVVGAATVLAGGGATGALLASPASAFGGIIVGWLSARHVLSRSDEPLDQDPPPLRMSDHVRVAVILFALAGLLHLDVLAVKGFFSPDEAAAYSALALIGRIVFWSGMMVGIVLLPFVVWRAAAGAGVIRAYLASLLLMAAVSGASALVILGWPEAVYGLIFGDRYPPYVELLPLYVAAAALLAVAVVTASLHIGAGHLRVWTGLVVILAGTVAGYAFAHDSPRTVLTVLLIGTAVAAIYLVAEAIALAHHRRVTAASAGQGAEVPSRP